MASLWRRTASRMLVTGYIVVLRNQTGMTTRQVKFGINDYLGAVVREAQGNPGKWAVELFHGTTKVELTQIKGSEAAARAYAKRWMTKKLTNLRAEYKQAEANVVADAVARGYAVEEGVHL